MRAAVALSLTLTLLAGGCFPDNAKHRTIAKVIEGGVAIGGVVMLATVNSGADCMTAIPGMPDQECEDKARLLSSLGLGMILTGLIGFIVTVSTSPEDKPDSPVIPKNPEPAVVPATTPTAPATTPPGATAPTPPTEPAPPTNPEPATPPPAPETPTTP